MMVVCSSSSSRVVVNALTTTTTIASSNRAILRMSSSLTSSSSKGKLLVLGGTGFLGQAVCQRALLEGYHVTSVSRRGKVVDKGSTTVTSSNKRKVDYRKGDMRQKETIVNILNEGGYTGIVHCIGLLFDNDSGLGQYNVFVSGSGSLIDKNSSYDSITRQTAFNAMDAAIDYIQQQQEQDKKEVKNNDSLPFCFTSAAEAGWPDVWGGSQVEQFLAPSWLRRYLSAKRQVEEKLMASQSLGLRPIIVRPSLIYAVDRPASFLPVGAFFLGNKVGLPFVDRPVNVQSLALAIVQSMSRPNVSGVQRYPQIDELTKQSSM